MPPPSRPRLLHSQQSPHNPINNDNNNTPPPDILYPIVEQAKPTPPTPTPKPPTRPKPVRTPPPRPKPQMKPKPTVITPPPIITVRPPSPIIPVIPPPPIIPVIPPPPIIPVIPPNNNNFNSDIIAPPIDILKDGGLTQKNSNKNLYLIGGAGLIAAIILMKNK